MKKTFFLVLLALVAGVALAIQLTRDPGYILIAYGNHTFETSLFALLVAVILLVVLFKLLVSLLKWFNPMRWFRSGDSGRP